MVKSSYVVQPNSKLLVELIWVVTIQAGIRGGGGGWMHSTSKEVLLLITKLIELVMCKLFVM